MKSSSSRFRGAARQTKRCLKWTLSLFALYLAILAIGLIPVNNGFHPTENGVTIYIISSAVHADIIIPKTTESKDWTRSFFASAFGQSMADESHVAFGWGDRGFYLETQTWNDLKVSTTANALLLPSKSCVHVSFTRPEYFPEAVSVTISQSQYEALVQYLEGTFQKDHDGQFRQIPGYAYSINDAFFDATGRYHLLNTCNSWVGRGLKSAGVRVPWFSPMPKTPMLYIENERHSR